MKSLTVTAIKIEPDGYPEITATTDWNGLVLEKGKGPGPKKVPIELIKAMNVFMPLVIEYGSLNDDWSEECGLDANVTTVSFGKEKVSFTAQLTKMIGKNSHTPSNTAAVAYSVLTIDQQSQIDALRREISRYINSLTDYKQEGLLVDDGVVSDEPGTAEKELRGVAA
ncbi:hypothetical protein D0962_01820 [Leptolyngbyaceae cyanobacterium CCMR0082]|uniref:Uncharacterized protein n=1 Tax=Adonisia turfae CCMR0082 TaxID=2304604 RepID=A0A6M0S052_9CYAN|nr:hypothetical protein [Adonisia turfae]NEZ61523.1 hypothetical protein [Adonisia turfae CCMR0082]